MEKMSTGLCNQLLDTAPLRTIFAGGEIRIFSGTEAATADAAETGTLIVTVKNGGAGINFAASASGGTIPKAGGETWSGTVLAGGPYTVTHYRMVAAGDAGGLSATDPRVQGTIGTGNADMNMGSTSLVGGSTFTLNFFTQSLVPS